MTFLLYSLPIIGALFGYLASLSILISFLKAFASDKKGGEFREKVSLRLNDIDFTPDFNQLLDKHLAEFTETLKTQIPMSATFLTGATSSKLQALAKTEFMKMAPELKEKLGDKIAQNLYFIKDLMKENMLKNVRKISFYGALVGFLVGVAASSILFLFRQF